ncbi:hypothetical protein A33M_3110 [Rhodovulum sp. PH10]|uniref:hypothetical protein n=1 Tax=Rhodovulum sp. PH10 TaxID=1187851 RepID=UPI00027C203B|nr:hypothetical protein [Rhodovulum sp. PH10]EJW11497.1 hypothetical protein A33M_3110 [Rhodovulum sp. PH10]
MLGRDHGAAMSRPLALSLAVRSWFDALSLTAIACLVASCVFAAVPAAAQVKNAPAIGTDAPLRWRVGGGNIVSHLVGRETAQLYAALNGIGAKLGRMDSYGWRDLSRKPAPRDFDAAMREAYMHGITPIMLLEYEGSYQTLDPPQPIGSYADWYAAGRAMAKRFRPDGDWGRENGIENFGVTVFTAINEPDVQATIPKDAYHDALAGLADGVHSIDKTLRVVPGGFATCNSHGDATLRGYGPAIADLLADGRLDGIDLHTYYNARWFPLTRGQEFSAQSCFDRVKAAMKISRDVNFYATEFNVARDDAWSDETLAAKLFLTAFWDNVGVAGANGRPATVLASPWNLADTGRIEGPAYAMAAREAPWAPDARARVLAMVLKLAGDKRITSLDRVRGLVTLEDDDGIVIAWQNLPGWTDRPGKELRIELPAWAQRAEVWGFDGPRETVPVHGGDNVIELPANETIMLRIPRPHP